MNARKSGKKMTSRGGDILLETSRVLISRLDIFTMKFLYIIYKSICCLVIVAKEGRLLEHYINRSIQPKKQIQINLTYKEVVKYLSKVMHLS